MGVHRAAGTKINCVVTYSCIFDLYYFKFLERYGRLNILYFLYTSALTIIKLALGSDVHTYICTYTTAAQEQQAIQLHSLFVFLFFVE